MSGMVTSAVRETTTNAILAKKLNEMAISSSACQDFFSRNNVTTG